MKFKVKYRRFLQEDVECVIEAETKIQAMSLVKTRAEKDDVKDLMFINSRVISMEDLEGNK